MPSGRLAPALRHRDFRLFWFGQVVSLIGTSLQVVAEGWLVYQLTGSTLWLGLVGFLALLPVVPISFLGGVLIDRVPRRRLLIATQLGLMGQATVYGLLARSGHIQLWQIVLLYFVFGALLAVDHPARRAYLVELVDRDSLANAVALNGAIFNVASLTGYAASGFLIAAFGAGGTMLINAVSYVAPIVALLAIQTPDRRSDTSGAPLRVAWKEGIAALWPVGADGVRPLPGVIGLMALVGGQAYAVSGMMPAYAATVLGTGSVGLGLLWAACALGAVIGTAVVARLGLRHRGRTLATASLFLPVLVLGFSRVRTMAPALVLLVAIGVALLLLQSMAVTLVQVHTADRIRGRVMTLYSQVHAGADTASNMMVGALAARLGLPAALSLSALAALAVALLFRWRMPAIRRLQ